MQKPLPRKFKIGDRVLFVKEKDEEGEIIEIIGDFKAIVLNSSGFKVPVLLKDLILFEEFMEELESWFDEEDFEKSILNNKKEMFANKEKNVKAKLFNLKQRSKRLGSKEIDLHINLLIDDYSNLSNAEMIEIQIREFEAELNKVLNTNTEELIVIHGIGTGILKENIHKILNEYKLRYYLSSDGGSTTIFL